MKDQAETLRRLMRERFWKPRREPDPAIAVYLAPAARRLRLFSPRELALRNRKLGCGLRVRDESDPISADGGTPNIRGRLAVLTGEESDLVACYQRVKSQSKNEGVKKMDVIVCGVDGESEGRRIFSKLFETCRRFLDVELVYRGAIPRGEKISESVAIQNFLLHYRSRAGSPVG